MFTHTYLSCGLTLEATIVDTAGCPLLTNAATVLVQHPPQPDPTTSTELCLDVRPRALVIVSPTMS